MLEVKLVGYDDLTEEEQGSASNNGCGKENARYLKVTHGGNLIALENDAMEPEDAVLYRDLAWVGPLLLKCYELGKKDA